MTVDVHKRLNRFGLLGQSVDVLHQTFDGEDGRVQLWVRIDELSIQIVSFQSRAIVAGNNSIWVRHRHNFKHDLTA